MKHSKEYLEAFKSKRSYNHDLLNIVTLQEQDKVTQIVESQWKSSNGLYIITWINETIYNL